MNRPTSAQLWLLAKLAVIAFCLGGVVLTTLRLEGFGFAPKAAPLPDPTIIIVPTPSPLAAPNSVDATIAEISAHFAAGDYQRALTLAEESLRKPLKPEVRAWVNQELATLLTSVGWIKLKLGDCAQAVPLFTRAEARGSNKASLKGLAYCHYKLHNYVDAAVLMKTYVDANPHDQDVSLLYVDVLESDQRFADAVSILERLVTDAGTSPTADDLKKRLTAMRARSSESSRQASTSSRHFSVIYREGEYEDLAGQTLQILEEALDEFIVQFGFQDVTNPIEVTLYPAAQFSVLTGGPTWADGVFDGRIRVPISSRSRDTLKRVLRHELVHALYAIMLDFRALPTWFNEGIAQRLECSPVPCSAFFGQGFPPVPGAFLQHQAFDAPFITLSATQANMAYMQSLYLVATLENEAGNDFLRRINTGLDGTSAIDSNALCKKLGHSFPEYYELAQHYWTSRTKLLNFAEPQ